MIAPGRQEMLCVMDAQATALGLDVVRTAPLKSIESPGKRERLSGWRRRNKRI
jgi:hypothetical protein